MAVLKDYRCLAHGVFESKTAVCPHGCTTVVPMFLKAPGGRSDKTKASDRALEHLAKRYGLDDMSNRNGSVGNSRKHPSGMEPRWGEIPDGKLDGITAPLNAGIPDIEKQLGALPTFMDMKSVLPRVRPVPAIMPADGKFQDSGTLDRAIASS